MLFAYLDESGIGDILNERHVVIAGVLVSDQKVDAVEKRIAEVRDKYVPERYRTGFIFHAADLYQGNDKRIRKEDWPTATRRDALEQLMQIPAEFELPVAQGHVPRERIRNDRPEMTADQVIRFTQAIAASTCMLHIERFARLWAAPGEQVTLIYENNDRAREGVKQIQEFLASGSFLKQLDSRLLPVIGDLLPRRVLEPAQFAKKEAAPILQIADACAYMFRRAIADKECERFVRHVRDLTITNRQGRWTLGKPRTLPTS